MAKRSGPAPSPLRPAQLNAQQMTAGIAKLRRRGAELETLKPETMRDLGIEAETITNKINATLRDVFGDHTIEYNEYAVTWSSFVVMVLGGTSRHEEIRAFQRGIESARAKFNDGSWGALGASGG